MIDFERLRDEFAKKVKRKPAALQNIRDIVEKKLAQMLTCNPLRMDYYKKYQEIIGEATAVFCETCALAFLPDLDYL